MRAMAVAPFLAWAGRSAVDPALGATANHQQNPMAQSPIGQNPMHEPGQFPGEPSGPGQPPWPGNQGQLPSMKVDPRAILIENQKNIRKDVSQLYDLAGKLRKQVADTDSSEVLSLDMIHTADQIEKLAKHIKDLAKD